MSSFALVVCGPDTDVGKTGVSAWLVQGLNATYWKQVQSGLDDGGDRGRIQSCLILTRACSRRRSFSTPSTPLGRRT